MSVQVRRIDEDDWAVAATLAGAGGF